ncbi:MAG: hypothetical protein ACR2G1_08005, partial [Rubrobacteraceae bacterium]
MDGLMEGNEVQPFEKGLENTGSERLRSDEWFFYPHYEVRSRDAQNYIRASETVEQLQGRGRYKPLSVEYADLFVEFAGWADRHEMSRRDPTEARNEKAAVAWAESYGVLGLDPPRMVLLGGSSTFIEDYLGWPGPDGSSGRGWLNEGFGGPAETIARFTGEALEARAVLRLYNAAIAQDTESIVNMMGTERDDLGYQSIREMYGQNDDSARAWALEIVQEMVNRKIAGRCYPTLHGNPGSYEQGWSFNSLLGAMWLQMYFRLIGQTKVCLWCGAILV